MKIKITAPCTVRLNLEPGDVIDVQTLSPELETLLNARRIDDSSVARLIGGGRQELEKAVSVP